VCVHQNRKSLEERYAKGWRVIDLVKWYSVKFSDLTEHLKESGLEKKFKSARQIKIDEFCDEVIRASLPMLEGKSTSKSLYIRDAIDAAKVKMKIKDQRKIEELWEFVDQVGKETNTGEGEPNIKKTVNRLTKIMGKDGEVETEFWGPFCS